jgi:hypothetical protein
VSFQIVKADVIGTTSTTTTGAGAEPPPPQAASDRAIIEIPLAFAAFLVFLVSQFSTSLATVFMALSCSLERVAKFVPKSFPEHYIHQINTRSLPPQFGQ